MHTLFNFPSTRAHNVRVCCLHIATSAIGDNRAFCGGFWLPNVSGVSAAKWCALFVKTFAAGKGTHTHFTAHDTAICVVRWREEARGCSKNYIKWCAILRQAYQNTLSTVSNATSPCAQFYPLPHFQPLYSNNRCNLYSTSIWTVPYVLRKARTHTRTIASAVAVQTHPHPTHSMHR